MDDLLRNALNRLSAQNDKLKEAEKLYLELEAHKKVLLSQLILKQGLGKSHADKETRAQVTEDWIDFVQGLAEAETNFNNEKRKYSIYENAYYAELATYKREVDVIKKQGVNT